jgi:group II intron reverse transcriptase/maturase
VDLDMSKFFDEVHHDRLMSRLSQRIGDKDLLKLIHRFLRSGMMEGGLLGQKVKGTPQGGPLSPLLSNIVLDELDKELERRGHQFVRYADDVIVLVKSEASAHRVMASLTTFIEGKLRLKINRVKSQIVRSWELNFLGHNIGRDYLGLSRSSEQRLKSKLKALTSRSRGRSMASIIEEVNSSLHGWLHYFRYARMKRKLRNLYSWLKRRLRCYRLKQCKRAIGIWRFLVSLGVPKERSWTTAASRKGWWRRSATPGAHEGMNNPWFNSIGLLDIPTLYQKLHV